MIEKQEINQSLPLADKLLAVSKYVIATCELLIQEDPRIPYYKWHQSGCPSLAIEAIIQSMSWDIFSKFTVIFSSLTVAEPDFAASLEIRPGDKLPKDDPLADYIIKSFCNHYQARPDFGGQGGNRTLNPLGTRF